MINFKELYVQSGSLVLFNCFPFSTGMGLPTKQVFGSCFTPLTIFCKGTSCHIYYEKQRLDNLAANALAKLSTDFNLIYNKFKKSCIKLEKLSLQAEQKPLSLAKGFQKSWGEMIEFWKWSVFIDAFDTGTDFNEINRIATKNKLTREEVQLLTTPAELSYLQEFELSVINALQSNNIAELVNKFFWINTSYVGLGVFSESEARQEVEKRKGEKWRKTLEDMHSYIENLREKQDKILKEKKLEKNPLWFYNKLVSWRDERKRFNFTGLHGLNFYCRELVRESGLPVELYKVVTPPECFSQEFPSAVELKTRFNNGAAIEMFEDHSNLVTGADAADLFNKLQSQRLDKHFDLRGQPACLGRVTGKVIVIAGPQDFAKFQEGAILVTGMTRPEFVPIMKKAVGIITDEGGVTCHAAIVSRELNKPCIIGTQNASKVLKTGDVVELDAFHGLVKKLK